MIQCEAAVCRARPGLPDTEDLLSLSNRTSARAHPVRTYRQQYEHQEQQRCDYPQRVMALAAEATDNTSRSGGKTLRLTHGDVGGQAAHQRDSIRVVAPARSTHAGPCTTGRRTPTPAAGTTTRHAERAYGPQHDCPVSACFLVGHDMKIRGVEVRSGQESKVRAAA